MFAREVLYDTAGSSVYGGWAALQRVVRTESTGPSKKKNISDIQF